MSRFRAGNVVLLLCICLSWSSVTAAQDFLLDGARTTVRTESGPVTGLRRLDVDAFRSIPYAAPPVGSRRFRPAKPAARWNSPRLAIERGPACPQLLDPENPAEDGDSVMSEDCLTLNVWTPRTDGQARPVMVFIHGGALVQGSAADRWYDGAALAKRGDVVVVSIQYRLGALGFLSLAGIGGTDFVSSGNLGLLDQIAALRWVKKNIAAFGGDASNVTVFGQSAGGASVYALLATPFARGLFQKAIIQSADPGQFSSEEDAARVTRAFMTIAHVKTVAELQGLTMEDILRAQAALSTKADIGGFNFVNDGVVFTAAPLDMIAHAPASSVPLLIGTNVEEMRYAVALEGLPIDQQPDAPLRARLSAVFGPEGGQLVDRYKQSMGAYPEAVTMLIGDAIFRIPSIRLAEINATRRATFVYLFTFRSRTRGPTGLEYGAMHTLELPFIFAADSPMTYSFVGAKGTWTHLSDQMVAAWTSFARRGDPGNPLLPPWPRYNSASHLTMELGVHSDVVLDPYGAERRAWDRIPSGMLNDVGVLKLWAPAAN